MNDELPASRLKSELLAAGVPVRAICYDGVFLVTYEPSVTLGDIDIAQPIIAAAYARVPNKKD